MELDYITESSSSTYDDTFALVKVHPLRYFFYLSELYIFAKRKGVEHLYYCPDSASRNHYFGKYKCYDSSLRFQCCGGIKTGIHGRKQFEKSFTTLMDTLSTLKIHDEH